MFPRGRAPVAFARPCPLRIPPPTLPPPSSTFRSSTGLLLFGRSSTFLMPLFLCCPHLLFSQTAVTPLCVCVKHFLFGKRRRMADVARTSEPRTDRMGDAADAADVHLEGRSGRRPPTAGRRRIVRPRGGGPEVRKAGGVAKRPVGGGKFSQSQRRHVVLTDDAVHWFATEHDHAAGSGPKGWLPLAGARVERHGAEPCVHAADMSALPISQVPTQAGAPGRIVRVRGGAPGLLRRLASGKMRGPSGDAHVPPSGVASFFAAKAPHGEAPGRLVGGVELGGEGDVAALHAQLAEARAEASALRSRVAELEAQLAASRAEVSARRGGGTPLSTEVHPVEDVGVRAIGEAQARQREAGGFEGAKHLFGPEGLPPELWGVSRPQLVAFRDEVRRAVAKGRLRNEHAHDPRHPFHYAPERFRDPEVGPNMYQVTEQVLKPRARARAGLPGVSYAVEQNLEAGGLRCALFFSHAWSEGVYEFVENALAAWPDDLAECGAYVCFLANPQTLDISQLLGEEVQASPFYKVLSSRPRVIMLANSHTPIHTRWWCVYEAHLAKQLSLDVRLAGRPLQLLTGPLAERLRLKEDAAAKRATERLAEVRSAYGRARARSGGAALVALVDALDEAEREVERAKLDVLLADDAALLDLGRAQCFSAADKARIEAEVRGHEGEVVALLASLIRDVVCEGADIDDVERVDARNVPVLALAAWLRTPRPRVTTLIAPGAPPTLLCRAVATTLPSLRTLVGDADDALASACAARGVELTRASDGARVDARAAVLAAALDVPAADAAEVLALARPPTSADPAALRKWYVRALRAEHARVDDALTGERMDAVGECIAIGVEGTDAAGRPLGVRDAASLSAWLGRAPALLTAGAASGKTVLLSQLVVHALEGPLLPIVVRADRLQRQLATHADAFARAAHWVEAAVRLEHGDSALGTMLCDAMRANEALLLIDGLDEAGRGRARLEEHVTRVLAPRGHAMLVTSRPAGLDERAFDEFARLQLVPLTDVQQRAVLHQRLDPARAAELEEYVRDRVPIDVETQRRVTANPYAWHAPPPPLSRSLGARAQRSAIPLPPPFAPNSRRLPCSSAQSDAVDGRRDRPEARPRNAAHDRRAVRGGDGRHDRACERAPDAGDVDAAARGFLRGACEGAPRHHHGAHRGRRADGGPRGGRRARRPRHTGSAAARAAAREGATADAGGAPLVSGVWCDARAVRDSRVAAARLCVERVVDERRADGRGVRLGVWPAVCRGGRDGGQCDAGRDRRRAVACACGECARRTEAGGGVDPGGRGGGARRRGGGGARRGARARGRG